MKFKHYKGGVYDLVTLATDEATNEPLVIYRSQDGTVWSRPSGVFFQPLNVAGQRVRRFEFVPPEGHALSCDSGCGNPVLVAKPFEFSRTETTSGELIQSRCQAIWQCGCCHHDIALYRESDGALLDVETAQPEVDLAVRTVSVDEIKAAADSLGLKSAASVWPFPTKHREF